MRFERRINLLALAAGFPGAGIAIGLLWTGDYPSKMQWTLTLLVLIAWIGFSAAVRERVVFPLRTFSNLLAALREGDYSFRARAGDPRDALGEVIMQVNAMAETLREQRLSALEATALLRKVMAEIDVAVFAFDGDQRLQLVNRAGEKLLARSAERSIGLGAGDLGLGGLLAQEPPPTVRIAFPGGAGTWGVRRSDFRERGLTHTLLVITNLTQPLRQEELEAWQRLVRVLGHEINNSLTPVKSISRSLSDLLGRDPLPDDWRDDARTGLNVIAGRADALSRFTGAYARLARLPQPELRPLNVEDWILRVGQLEQRLHVRLIRGPAVTIQGDPDQLEQLLINLLRNAVEAAQELNGGVSICWETTATQLEVFVEDEGTGIANPANLFVPFFTTKPHGSGIGLLLSRQIAEAHGGELRLCNRTDRSGARAELRLPLR